MIYSYEGPSLTYSKYRFVMTILIEYERELATLPSAGTEMATDAIRKL
jgi:hypothetical protein